MSQKSVHRAALAVFASLVCVSASAQPLPVPGGDGRGGQPAIPNQTTSNPATVPAVDESGGLYVVVEAASRPMDALYVVAPVCGGAKPAPELKVACDLLESVLANDARLSGFVRPIRHTPGLAAQVIKAPMPTFAVKPGGPAAAGLQYVIALSVKPAKQPGLLDMNATLYDVRAGKLLDLGDQGSQIVPQASMRQAAHRLMNAVQGAITGIEGTYDTVIYYSAPAPGCCC